MKASLTLVGLAVYFATVCVAAVYSDARWGYHCEPKTRPGKAVKHCPYPHP